MCHSLATRFTMTRSYSNNRYIWASKLSPEAGNPHCIFARHRWKERPEREPRTADGPRLLAQVSGLGGHWRRPKSSRCVSFNMRPCTVAPAPRTLEQPTPLSVAGECPFHPAQGVHIRVEVATEPNISTIGLRSTPNHQVHDSRAEGCQRIRVRSLSGCHDTYIGCSGNTI